MELSPSTTCNFDTSPIVSVDVVDVFDNNFQPFFVLHKALARKCERKSSAYGRTKKKVDIVAVQEVNDSIYEQLNLEAFKSTWSKIDSTVKEVFREINIALFERIHRWVFESFPMIKSINPLHITKPYPIVTCVTYRRIPTALLFTNNIEFVDDLLMFQDLKGYMQSNECHAVFLPALNFSIKHGIGSCLSSLYRQLARKASNVVDVSLIASWYCKDENCNKPIVVIIDDIERCDSIILADFIKMLSEWLMKIPINFILGVTTTFDVVRKLLPSSVLQNLQLCKFTLESPQKRMDSIIESIFVRSCSGFCIGYKVALFLRNHFLKNDGTITFFLKALKLACIKHFIGEPLSFLCPGMLHEDFEAFWSDKCELLSEVLKSNAFDLSSCQRRKIIGDNNLAQGLSKLKLMHDSWSSIVLCLFEVGKISKIQLLDIFCEAVDPTFCSNGALGQQLFPPLSVSHKSDAKTCSINGGFISQAIENVRELSSESLCQLLNRWSLHTEKVIEMDKEVKALLLRTLPSDGHISKEKCTVNINRCSTSSIRGKGTSVLNDEAAMLLANMLRKFLLPIESVPFHKICCFQDVASLKPALIGDSRRAIHNDLLKSEEYLQNTSCCRGEHVLSSFSHDTSITYSLAQEYGDLINLHDWYHSFKTKVLIPSPKPKHKVQRSRTSTNGKYTTLENEISIQARFCKAVTELQITGLVRMPSKRRPDFLQRIVFDP